MRDAAILSAVGIDDDGKRRVLGLSVALSEAEVHWRGFLDSLVACGLRGVRFITSDDHAGLVAARKAVFPGAVWPGAVWPGAVWPGAVFPGAVWQRCQFHLARNAIHHAPTVATRKAIGRQLRAVWKILSRRAVATGGGDVPVDRAFASSTSATAASRSSKANCRASASSFSDHLP